VPIRCCLLRSSRRAPNNNEDQKVRIGRFVRSMQRRWARLVACVASAALVTGGLAVYPATAAVGEESLFSLNGFPMNQPQPASLAEAAAQAAGQPGVTNQKPERTHKTVAELEEIARPGKYVVAVPAPKTAEMSATAFSPVDDVITGEECRNFYNNAPSPAPEHWYKNRFNACYGNLMRIVKKIRNSSGQVITEAFGQFKAVFLVSMNPNMRSATVTLELSDFYKDSSKFPETQRVSFGSGCWDPAPTGPTCTPTTTTFEDSFAGFRANPRRFATVNFTGTGAHLPNDPALNELRSFYDIEPYWYMETGIPGMSDFYKYPVFHQRCDVARTVVNSQYVRGSDCVFHEASGFFQLARHDGATEESVEFIHDAQTNITATKPGIPGSWVPGTYGTRPPLSRLYYDEAMRDANRLASKATCVREFGANYPNDRTDGFKNDCDEFPFAATHQGSYSVTNPSDRSYAVRALRSDQNQAVGNLLSQYSAGDHILEEDTYYVIIN